MIDRVEPMLEFALPIETTMHCCDASCSAQCVSTPQLDITTQLFIRAVDDPSLVYAVSTAP